MVQTGSKRTERRATLFDGMLVLCKRKRSSSASGQAGPNGIPVEYKLKDIIFIRKVEIKDRDDTDGKNSPPLSPTHFLKKYRNMIQLVCSRRSKCLWNRS